MIENLSLAFPGMVMEGGRKEVVLTVHQQGETHLRYVRGKQGCPGTGSQEVFREERETWGKQESFEV